MELEYGYKDVHSSYFNSGCCCFNDGDITGIEIAEGYIRLIKWHIDNDVPKRIVLEEKSLKDIILEMEDVAVSRRIPWFPLMHELMGLREAIVINAPGNVPLI